MDGRGKAAEALLGSDAIDVNRGDNQHRQSPLSIAITCGRDEHIEYGSDKADSEELRYVKVVEHLLADARVDADSPDSTDRTPLSSAAGAGNTDVVRMLLSKAAVDVNSRDSEYGQTPLSWAAENGHREVVELLLGDPTVDIDSVGKGGVSAVLKAHGNGHEEIVELLLEKGAEMVGIADIIMSWG